MSTKYTVPFALTFSMDFGDAKDDVSVTIDGRYDVNVYEPEEDCPYTRGEINATVFPKESQRNIYNHLNPSIIGPMEDKAIAIAVRKHQAK